MKVSLEIRRLQACQWLVSAHSNKRFAGNEDWQERLLYKKATSLQDEEKATTFKKKEAYYGSLFKSAI